MQAREKAIDRVHLVVGEMSREVPLDTVHVHLRGDPQPPSTLVGHHRLTTAVGSSLDDLPLVMPSTQLREVVVGTGVALRIVNRETGATPARMALTPAGVVRVGGVGAIAADVACAAVELLGDIGNLRIKECGDPECTRIFIDRSRGGNRHWCGMEECGNRVKAAAYRSRKAKV